MSQTTYTEHLSLILLIAMGKKELLFTYSIRCISTFSDYNSFRCVNTHINFLDALHHISYSHSVVPGGFDVRSYITRDIPGTVCICSTIALTT